MRSGSPDRRGLPMVIVLGLIGTGLSARPPVASPWYWPAKCAVSSWTVHPAQSVGAAQSASSRVDSSARQASSSAVATSAAPPHLRKCSSRADRATLAGVPPCAGECRHVRGFPVWTPPEAAGLWDICGAKDSQFKLSARLCVAGIEQTPHWLACHLSDQLVVMVDVQYLGTV